MALSGSTLGQAIWTSLQVTFPGLATLYRANPDAGVGTHRPMEQIALALGMSTVSVLTTTAQHTSAIVGTTVGASPVTPNPFPAVFPGSGATSTAVKATLLSSLGWNGPAGSKVLDSLIQPALDYVVTNTGLLFAGAITPSGATMITTLAASPTPTTLASQISEAAQTTLLASGFFHLMDDPSQGLALELVKLLNAWSTGLMTMMSTLNTPIPVAPIGGAGGGAATFTGAFV